MGGILKVEKLKVKIRNKIKLQTKSKNGAKTGTNRDLP
jgi:hypothetical protein